MNVYIPTKKLNALHILLFNHAQKRRKKLTLVDKANVLETSGFGEK